MSHPLDGIRAKIGRANEHLDTLSREINVLFQSHPYRELINYTFDGTWHIISTDPPLDEPPPLRFSLLCGDAVHNLRCALDHLVWQLVLAENNRPDKWNQFPVYIHSKGFDGRVRFPKDPKRNPLHGIDPNGQPWALIEEKQPYNRRKFGKDPRGDKLAILAELSNIDKHRTLMVQMLFPGTDTVWDAVGWNPEVRLLDYRLTFGPLSLVQETEIVRLKFSDSGPDPQVHMKGTLAIDPSFGDEMNQTPIRTIKNTLGYV